MPTPRTLSRAELQKLRADARAEFPDDEMMKEIHFIRLVHMAQTSHFTPEQHVAYLNGFIPKARRSPVSSR